MPGEGLIELIRKTASAEAERAAPVELMTGEVVSENPLRIGVEGGTLAVGGEMVMLSALCREMQSGETALWRGLRTGDRVRLLRVMGGQAYYVMEREEGLTL